MSYRSVFAAAIVFGATLADCYAADDVETFTEAVAIMKEIAINKKGIDPVNGGISTLELERIEKVLVFVEKELRASAACAAPQSNPSGVWEQQVTCEWQCVRVGRKSQWRLVRVCRWIYLEDKEKMKACATAPKSLHETTVSMLDEDVIDQVKMGANNRSGYEYALQVLAIVLSADLAADTGSEPGTIADP